MREKFLLRHDWQISAFRSRHREFIAKNSGPILDWFRKLPLYQWVPLNVPESRMEEVIGTLCLLYIDGQINLCVNHGVTHIQRFANSDEEYEEYLQKLRHQ